MTRHLLLVDDAPAEAQAALARVAALDVSTATTVAAARAYLSGSAFDAVAVRDGLDADGSLAALAEGLAVPGGVVGYASPDVLVAHFGGASAEAPSGGAVPPASDDERAALARDVGRVAHDLANPLAVIAGNAQLGREIAAATGADDSLAGIFDDIAEAAAELERRLDALAALRARIEARPR